VGVLSVVVEDLIVVVGIQEGPTRTNHDMPPSLYRPYTALKASDGLASAKWLAIKPFGYWLWLNVNLAIT
jgi:hypothetical protein